MRVITMIVATFVATVSSVVAQQRLTPRQKADRAAWQHRQMADPATGQVPLERLQDAYEKLERQSAVSNRLETRSMANCDNPNWIEIGPDSVTSGGRVRSLCVLPSGKAFAGSVTGGLWTCDNIRATTPFWRKVNDFFQNLCVSTIAVHPKNPNILYFGTGEGWLNDAIPYSNIQTYSYYNRGNGIWKSIDGGVTWNVLPNTQNGNFRFTQKILITATGKVYAGTHRGIFKSWNDATWSSIMGTGIAGLAVDEVADMELGRDSLLYASFGINRHGGIFIMTLDSVWSRIGGGTLSNGLPAANDNNFRRVELACAPNNANVLYAAIEFGQTVGTNIFERVRIYRSQNQGNTWIRIPLDSTTTNQGSYSVALSVPLRDENTIYFGNTDLLRRVTLSVNASGQLGATPIWQSLAAHNGANSLPNVHADYHQIVFDPVDTTNAAYLCTDGGIFKALVINSVNPTFFPINRNLRIVQFQTCALAAPANNFDFLAGSQDNSMHQFGGSGCLNTSVKFPEQIGDGGYAFINPYNSDQRVISAFYNYYFMSTNGGRSYQFDTMSNGGGLFLNPTDWSIPDAVPTSTSIVNMFSTSTNGLYRWNNIFAARNRPVELTSSFITSAPTAVKVSPNNANTVYVAVSGSTPRIIKITNANSTSPTFSNITSNLTQTGYISCIEIAKKAIGDDEIIVTFSNYGIPSIYYTQTGTSSSPNWIPIDGSTLPDIPIRWALFTPNNPYNYKILLATEAGVWTTTAINGPSTIWQSINNGDLPNVPVYMMRYRPSDSLVLVATHGRGLWRSDMFSSLKVNFRALTSSVSATACPQTFISCTSGAITSYQWDFQKDNITDATTANPTTSAYGNYIRFAVNNSTICITKDREDLFKILNPTTICSATSGGKGSSSSAVAALMRINPNPTTGVLYIDAVSEIQSVDLYNINGQLVGKYDNNTILDIEKQIAGLYFCKVTFADGQIATQKIVKQ